MTADLPRRPTLVAAQFAVTLRLRLSARLSGLQVGPRWSSLPDMLRTGWNAGSDVAILYSGPLTVLDRSSFPDLSGLLGVCG
jgi:hypothetical protein